MANPATQLLFKFIRLFRPFLVLLRALILRVWRRIEPILLVLKATRTVTGCAVLGAAGLVLTNQGREVGFSLVRPEHLGLFTWPSLVWWIKHLVALCFMSLWGVSCMNAARLLLVGLRTNSRLKTYWPAVLGVTCFGSVAAMLSGAFVRLGGYSLSLIVSALTCLALAIFVIYLATSTRAQTRQFPRLGKVYRQGSANLRWISFLTAALTFILATLVFWVLPGKAGFWAGSPLVIFAFLASVTGVLGFLAVGGRSARLPILTGLIAWALLVSLFPSNHRVRVLKDEAVLTELSDAIDLWQQRNPQNGETFRPVIIATAGGGLRAGYWTSTLLSQLDERLNEPGQTQRRDLAFAISGVSGGSVGAAFYAASLASKDSEGTTCKSDQKRTQQLSGVVGKDFLAATLGSMFFTDLLARFVPIAEIPDRAAAMEQAFETSWQDSSGCRNMETGVSALAKQISFPHLLLNATDTYTGRRVVVSSLNLRENQNYLMPEVIPFFDYHKTDISLSTAALMSARFTFISPAGNVEVENGEGRMRLVDGGYFENYGAETATDLLKILNEKFKAKIGAPAVRNNLKVANTNALFQPIVIQISSDPALAGSEMPNVGECDSDAGEALLTKRDGFFQNFAEEILAPIDGLLNTREARGTLAAKRLACLTRALNGRYFNFRMKAYKEVGKDTYYEAPLGWLLSPQSRAQIELQSQRTADADRQTCLEFERLVSELGAIGLTEECKSESEWDATASKEALESKAR